MKGTFDVQKSWFRVRVDQMFFDFDFRPEYRLTGITTGRRCGQWRFRFISHSRTLRVRADITDGAATAIAVDATATAGNATGTGIDATATVVDATATDVDTTVTAVDATTTAVNATTTTVNVTATVADTTVTAGNDITIVGNTTVAAGDTNATAVDDVTDFRHRYLLLLPRTGMVVKLSAVAW